MFEKVRWVDRWCFLLWCIWCFLLWCFLHDFVICEGFLLSVFCTLLIRVDILACLWRFKDICFLNYVWTISQNKKAKVWDKDMKGSSFGASSFGASSFNVSEVSAASLKPWPAKAWKVTASVLLRAVGASCCSSSPELTSLHSFQRFKEIYFSNYVLNYFPK